MSNGALVLQQQQQALAVASYRDKIDTIRQTVAKGATDAQLEMFLTLADKYSLDPFLKEIWYTPQVGIITGRDGYLKVAQRDPDFDGIVSCAVRAGDHFQMNPVIPEVTHQFGAKRGQVIGAYAIAFHKRRRPAVCYADLAEYRKSGNVWSTYTSAMICKVAEVMALKRQFGISGLVADVEVQAHEGSAAPSVASPKVDAPHDPDGIQPRQNRPPEEVTRMWNRMDALRRQDAKFGPLEIFTEIKDRFEELTGSTDGYYEILGKYKLSKSNELDFADDEQYTYARRVAAGLLMSLKAWRESHPQEPDAEPYEASDDDLPKVIAEAVHE